MTITANPETAAPVSTDQAAPATGAARLNAIVDDVQAALLGVLVKHRVTWEEYRAATGWLTTAGTQNFELPLLLDVFLSTTIDEIAHAGGEGTECNVEGPVYIPGAPILERPYVLPQRADEPGEKLVFSGTVRLTDGSPLAGAELDIWQASADGAYSQFHPEVPEYNLRGRLTTDADGAFSFSTVVSPPYEIPTGGSTGQLFAALGRSCYRPGHVHFKISHPDAAPLTTQLYFDHDPFLGSDVVGAVKSSLVITLERGDGTTCAYDFVLPGATS